MKIGTDIGHAAQRLQQGKLVAMPTETVYGLAANAYDEDAIKRIYQAKGRPSHNPLIVHVANVELAKKLAHWNKLAELLAGVFWPGPLTMVLARKEDSGISNLVTAGLGSIALRMPAHSVAAQLLAASNLPLAAPSANKSGFITATSPQHVAADFAGEDIYILDAPMTEIGIESTVIKIDPPAVTLLRSGSISQQQIEAVIGQQLVAAIRNDTDPSSPGMLSRHYAPKTKLRLNAKRLEPGEVLLAFGAPLASNSAACINLSESCDLSEACAHLFDALRQLDKMQANAIAVMPIPNEGVGVAINDRLKRAATP